MSTRLCLIGCGWIVRSNHGPVLRMLAGQGEVELAACCDLDLAAAQQVRDTIGFARADTDLAQMLDRERPDAVVVAVPDTAAHAAGRQVLLRGIPALLEKPPARTIAELDDLIALASGKHVITQVAVNRRFAPVLVEMKRRLATAGPVHCLQGWMMRTARRDADFTTTAIHLIDAVRFVLDDDYRSLTLRHQTWSSGGAAVTNFYLDGVMVRGTIVQIGICPDSGMGMERMTIRCAGRTLEAEVPPMGNAPQHNGILQDWRDGRPAETVSGKELLGRDEPHVVNGMLDQMASFARAVRAGSRSAVDLQDVRQSMQVMLALRERATTFSANRQ